MDIMSVHGRDVPGVEGLVEGVGAAEHVAFMRTTDETFQVSRGWLKEAAPSNMEVMSVTDETFQELRGRLKEAAWSNMAAHAGHGRDVPVGDVAVEVFGVGEHRAHVGD